MSFNKTLPWSTCGNVWNTDSCVSHTSTSTNNNSTNGTYETLYNVGSTISSIMNDVDNNGTVLVKQTVKRTSPSEEFWE